MKIKLMRKIEHWRENGAILDIIDQAESAERWTAVDNSIYDDFLEDFSSLVAAAIEDAGHDVVWVGQQSRGVGIVVQNSDAEADDVFSAAVEKCAKKLTADLVAAIACEKEYEATTE